MADEHTGYGVPGGQRGQSTTATAAVSDPTTEAGEPGTPETIAAPAKADEPAEPPISAGATSQNTDSAPDAANDGNEAVTPTDSSKHTSAHDTRHATAPTEDTTCSTGGATEFDVVVVGSGAAGMAAALKAKHSGLSVVVLEKAEHFGGSTARSGGGIWIPNNEVLQGDRGAARRTPKGPREPDTPEDARAYLKAIVGDVVPAELRDAFLDRGPEVVSFVLEHTPLRLQWVPNYSDYHPEAPGGRSNGRSVEPCAFDGHLLGDELRNLEPPYSASPLGVPVTQADYRWLSLIARHPRGVLRLFGLGARWLAGGVTGKHPLAMGQALAAGLRAGLQRADVPVLLNTALAGLVLDESMTGDKASAGENPATGGNTARHEASPAPPGATQRVLGIRTTDGRVFRARLGVVLAAGGFEHNEAMRTKYQRQPIGTEWTVGAKANTGDAITAGMKLGAAVDLMDDAWWGPSIPLTGGPWFALAERSRPGCIMVDAAGQRFVNESAPYVEAVHAMYGPGDGPGEHIPTWLIFDQRYRNRYMFTGISPGQKLPGRWFKAGVVVKASSLEKLAEKAGLPAEALEATVQRFNGFARDGVDKDFQRGLSAYDHYYGDPRNKPNSSLGPLDKAPFYAVKIVPGDLGTKGGLRTDAHARVLREDGSVIPGLYAAGNTSSAVMGHTYAGPGATIGPAMVFGYLAAEHLATQNRTGGRR